MFETFKTKKYPEDIPDFKKCKTQKERDELLHKRLKASDEVHRWNQRAITNQAMLFWIVPLGVVIGFIAGWFVVQIFSYYRP
jgi:hypothetical protein